MSRLLLTSLPELIYDSQAEVDLDIEAHQNESEIDGAVALYG